MSDDEKPGKRRKRSRLPQPPRRRPEGLEGEAEDLLRSAPRLDLHPRAQALSTGPAGLVGEEAASPQGSEPSWRESLEQKLRLLPRQSGVYVFRDARDQVLYVGKAKRLHLRVRSYFRGPAPTDPRLRGLRRRIRFLDWFVTANETEALILEDGLIKRYAPRFNVRLKDDKRYPYLKITVGHPFPALYLTRQIVADGARYFGPFTRVKELREILKVLRPVFQLRNCTDRRLAEDRRECLQYFIGRCTAPCTTRVDEQEYRQQVQPLIDFLSGRGQEVLERLRRWMLDAAGQLRFEESARLRDNITALEELLQAQNMTPAAEADTDVVGLAARGNQACGLFLHVRGGTVLGKTHRLLTGVEGVGASEQMRVLLSAVLLDRPAIPYRIATGIAPRNPDELRSALATRAGHPVEILTVRRGLLAPLLDLASRNAHLILEEEELQAAQKRQRVDRSVYALQEALGLLSPPYRIEGYDISNTQGTHAVASQVVFQDGKPLKSAYRRFRMIGTQGPDDFAMIGQVLRRRLSRLRMRDDTPPDLILVDGGKGQVGRAKEVLEETGFAGLPLVGLAKREEEIYLPAAEAPLRLPRSSEALRLLQRVRDESHRFAVRYHRGLRTAAQKASRLDQIAGVGVVRRRALLGRFGSIEGIRQAGPAALTQVPGIGPKLARSLWETLFGSGEENG